MQFVKKGNEFIILEGDMGLVMTREEAEELFVMIGHVLQDDDIERQENGQCDNIPTEEKEVLQ